MEKKCKKCGTTEKVNFDGMCKKCYDNSIVINESQSFKEAVNKKSFWKDKKNVAIVILSFILLCCLCSTDTQTVENNNELSRESDENKAQIAELNQKLEESSLQMTILQEEKEKLQAENQKLQGSNTQTEQLQANNQTLQTEKNTLEEQKKQLEQEKASLQAQNQELNLKIQELQSTAFSKTNQSDATSTTTASSTTTSSVPVADPNSEIVYITDTGEKYHRGGCSYLKNSKHEISKNSAVAQRYEPCSRCKP